MIIKGKWRVYFDPAPIPASGMDWAYVHDDYDGAPDANDTRCGRAGSPEECLAEIEERELL